MAAINLYEANPESAVLGLNVCEELQERQIGCAVGMAMVSTLCGVTGSKDSDRDGAHEALMVLAANHWKPKIIPEPISLVHRQTIARMRSTVLRKLNENGLMIYRHRQVPDNLGAFLIIAPLLYQDPDLRAGIAIESDFLLLLPILFSLVWNRESAEADNSIITHLLSQSSHMHTGLAYNRDEINGMIQPLIMTI